jgi:hypothetical protein
MKRLIVVVALATTVLLAVPAFAAAQNDVARGSGVFSFSSFSQFSFNAQSNFNGTGASGSASFTNPNADPNQVIKGRVTCLSVIGNEATISGDVTDVQGFTFETTIRSFIIRAEDSGKFSVTPDGVNYTFSTAPPPPEPSCLGAFAFTPFPIFSGEIVIKDANS